MSEWKKAATGIRYREHPTRKHGINPDRYYLYYYRVDGELVQEGLGWLSEGWTQEKVEKVRVDMKSSARNGGTKTLSKKREQANIAEAAALTVKDALEELWEKELSHKKSGAETKRLLNKDVLPVWGKSKVASITRRDIVLLLDEIKKRGAPILRNRVHGALTRFFNFCAERGMIDDSPCTRIRKEKEKTRKRVLDDNEIRLLWIALDPDKVQPMDSYRLTKLALRLVLLTGQRPGEVAGMEWKEIEGDIWHIPASRMKNGEAHDIPLTDLALETIEQARTLSGNSEFVFRSTRRDGPMSAHSLSRAIASHRETIGITERFTPHDLRRTFRTRLADIGIDDIVAERVLGHKLQGVLAIYNRHDYANEKRMALEKWERELQKILGMEVKTAKIVKMRRNHG